MDNQGNLFTKNTIECINVYNQAAKSEPEQSKDETIKARVTSNQLERIDDFCRGRRICRSDYIRKHLRLPPDYFDYIQTLIDESDLVLPLLKKLSRMK